MSADPWSTIRNIIGRVDALEAAVEDIAGPLVTTVQPANPVACAAALWIDPDRMGGDVCLSGHRLTVGYIAHCVADTGVDDFLADAGLRDRRRDVLVAVAWWVRNGPHERGDAATVVAWRKWAKLAWRDHDPVDPPQVPS